MLIGSKFFILLTILLLASPHALGQNLEIHHIDVGQADSTLIIGPNGTIILIDAGDSGYFSTDGGKIVYEYLESINVNQIDYIIVTHRDADHVGGFAFSNYATSRHSLLFAEREDGNIKSWPGLSGIDDDGNGFADFFSDDGCPDPAETPDLDEIRFGWSDPYFPLFAYDNGEEITIPYCDLTKTFRRYVQTVEAGGVRLPLGSYQDLMDAYNNPIDLGDGASARIVCSSGWVAENQNRISGTNGTSSLAVNSRSIGIYVQYKGFDYLVAGDLTGNGSPNMEQALKDLLVSICDSPDDDPIDVLRINHHGSDNSSEQSYLNDLKPEVAIFSLGDGNSYGFPKQEVIDRLHNIYLQPLKHIYLTEEGETGRNYYGMPHDFLYDAVVISTDGNTYTVTNSVNGLDEYTVDGRASCIGSFGADGDVDGEDLAAYITDTEGISLSDFAAAFGRDNCP